MLSRGALLLSLPLVLSVLPAQSPGAWTELVVATRPFARERHAMVFDAARGETVLFGGHNGAYMNDTWILNASGWVRRFPAASPAARADAAMAFDPVRQRTVLFGGMNGSQLADVWEWDGAAWTQRATSVPGVGSYGTATYDPLQGGVFYNRDAVNLLWNGTTATTVVVGQPMGGQSTGMVFDAASGGVFALRGGSWGAQVFSVPQGWQQVVNTGQGFFSLGEFAIAADSAQHRVIFHGGNGSVGSSSGNGNVETWQWTGYTWVVIGQQPSLSRHRMVFDAARGTFVMFGGRPNSGPLQDATNVWNESTLPAAYVLYGSGCSGTLAQAPRLRADAMWNTAPVLGGVFLALLDQLVPAQAVFGLIGLTDQSWNGQPLPHSLAAHGMPGCDLLTAPVATVNLGLANSGGTANWITMIPMNPGLVGVQFFQQALCVSPGANAAGLTWSNGGHGTIGVR